MFTVGMRTSRTMEGLFIFLTSDWWQLSIVFVSELTFACTRAVSSRWGTKENLSTQTGCNVFFFHFFKSVFLKCIYLHVHTHLSSHVGDSDVKCQIKSTQVIFLLLVELMEDQELRAETNCRIKSTQVWETNWTARKTSVENCSELTFHL